jgi:hypothetical protein
MVMKLAKQTKRLLALTAALVLAGQGTLACQSILGIEGDRSEVTYPYEGCNSSSCGDCLTSEDKSDCEGSTDGHSGSGNGGNGNHGGTANGGKSGSSNQSGNGNGEGGEGGDDNGGNGNSGNDDGGSPFGDGGNCVGTGCIAECICAGGDPTTCEADCGGGGGEVACSFNDSCASCESNWGACACSNYDTLQNCFYDSSIGRCPGDTGDCSTCMTSLDYCLCTIGDPESCYDSFNGFGAWADNCSVSTCISCSCDSCPLQNIMCVADAGCVAIYDCFFSNGCTELSCTACADTVANNGGIAGPSAGYAEALLGCRYDSGCTECFAAP